MTTEISTPPPLPNPLSPNFADTGFDFAMWMAIASQQMNALALELNTSVKNSMLGVTSTSTTSTLIALGAKVLTVDFNKGYVIGMPLKITNKANIANWMKGIVTAYNGTTGQLNIDIKTIGTIGTFADWSVSFDLPETGSGFVPVGSLIANKNLGNSFSSQGATFLKTGVIAPTATYPSAPTTTINDGATWLTKAGLSLDMPVLAANNAGTIIATGSNVASATYAISTDNGATWASATLPASVKGYPIWCGSYFLMMVIATAATVTFYTSTTGATGSWTARTVPSNFYVSGCYGDQGCIITTSTTQGYITVDGITYTSRTMPGGNLIGVWGNGYYYFGSGGSTIIQKTYDGVTFVTKTLPFAVQQPLGNQPIFAFGAGVFLYAQDNTNQKCFTTPDFENFTITPTLIASSAPTKRIFCNGTFILAPSAGSTAYTSSDLGLTWTARTLPASGSWTSMISSNGALVGLLNLSTTATQSVSGGLYTDTAKAMFADSPENTRPFYMRIA